MSRVDGALRVVLNVREGSEMTTLRRVVKKMIKEISHLELEAARFIANVLAQRSKEWIGVANAHVREENDSEEEEGEGHAMANVLLNVEGMEDAMLFVEPTLSDESSYFLEGSGRMYVPLCDTKGLAHLFRSAPGVKRELELVCISARYEYEVHTPSEGVVLVETSV